MPRRIALIASTLVVALVLAGCGSDDDSADDERDTTTTEETTEESTEPSTIEDGETTVPEETTEPEEETTASAPDDSTTTTTGGGGEGDAEFCAAYGAFDDEASDLPDETLEDFQASVEFLRTELPLVAEVAPDELAEDFDTVVATVEQVPEAIEDATTAEEAQQASLEVFEGSGFQEAITRIDDYFVAGCAEANDDQADGSGAEPPETVTPG